MATLERAIEIAREAHRGQVDKAGCDYIGHPLRVMAAGRNTAEKIAGVLHDVVEESSWTFAMLQAEGFASEIIEALRCLTRNDGESYDGYISRVKGNALAVAVKLNDLADNMDVRRLPVLAEKDVERLKRYHIAYMTLAGHHHAGAVPDGELPWDSDDSELSQMYNGG
jgi:(p)ppGpp synthase/HD superfamily hydrolase